VGVVAFPMGWVADNSIRLRILKAVLNAIDKAQQRSCRQFDPVADTESEVDAIKMAIAYDVADNSIRLRILKGTGGFGRDLQNLRCRQFDPVADTERRIARGLDHEVHSCRQFDPVADTESLIDTEGLAATDDLLQTIRSGCGY